MLNKYSILSGGLLPMEKNTYILQACRQGCEERQSQHVYKTETMFGDQECPNEASIQSSCNRHFRGMWAPTFTEMTSIL